jgi:hypothetical protein
MQLPKPTLLLIPLAMSACAIDPTAADEGDFGDEGVTEPAAVEPIAACVLPQTTPPYDDTFTLTSANPTHTFVNGSYGNDECSSYVASAKYVQSLTSRPFVYVDNAQDCIRVSLTVLKYRKLSTGWQYQGAETATGVWTIDGCRYPSIAYAASAPDEARVDVRAKKTHCAGQWCGTTYGVPVIVEATRYIQIN